MATANQKGIADDWIKGTINKKYGIDSKKDLNINQFNEIMKYFGTLKNKENVI
jgi:hypothetical protein